MSAIVAAKEFHPMRGHVAAETCVHFSNGTTLFVRPDGVGWALFNSAGDRVSGRGLDAQGLTKEIVERDTK